MVDRSYADCGCSQTILSFQREINGDEKLCIKKSIIYLIYNCIRNIFRARLTIIETATPPFISNDDLILSSPSRFIVENVFHEIIRDQFARLKGTVLEVGCGSGRLTTILEKVDFEGAYTGVDFKERFNAVSTKHIDVNFIECDVHLFNSQELYNAIISVSALEHISNPEKLAKKLNSLLAKEGVELHAVPSGWSLPLYLWHGYRQYSLGRILELYDKPQVYRIGGPLCFLLHFFVITIGEMVFRLEGRARFPSLYSKLLKFCVKIDRYLPLMPSAFVIVSKKKSTK